MKSTRAALGTAVVAASLAACSPTAGEPAVIDTPQPVPVSTPTPSEAFEAIAADVDDADSVADAVAAALVTVDSAADVSPLVAVDRAAQWLTPELAATFAATLTTSGAGWWSELQAHRGSTSARVTHVEDAGQPQDTTTTAYRVRWVERVPAAPDGWEGEVYGQTLFITMARADPTMAWLVSDITVG